jgi:membrane protease subunit HflC
VGWKITDPATFLPKFAGNDDPIAEAEKRLSDQLGNFDRAIVGKHPLSDFVSATDNGTNLANIENEILTAIRNQVSSNHWGIEVKFLGFKKLQLPESVTQSVFDRMKSEREILSKKSASEGEAEASKIRSEAELRAANLVSDAQSEAVRIKAEGEAKATESLRTFEQNPELARFLFELNALEGSLKERSILVFDQHTTPFDLFRNVSTNLVKPK